MPEPRFTHPHDNPPVSRAGEAYAVDGGIAISLVERWGMVTATPDGEDSAGRSRLRLLTPDELVERACTTASLLCERLRARGWLVPVPEFVERRPTPTKE